MHPLQLRIPWHKNLWRVEKEAQQLWYPFSRLLEVEVVQAVSPVSSPESESNISIVDLWTTDAELTPGC